MTYIKFSNYLAIVTRFTKLPIFWLYGILHRMCKNGIAYVYVMLYNRFLFWTKTPAKLNLMLTTLNLVTLLIYSYSCKYLD